MATFANESDMSQFHFKQFSIQQSSSAMKVTLDACLFAAYVANQYDDVEDILDLGMGTGLLGLMLAQSINARVTGIELDHDAYQEALLNAQSSPFKERVTVRQADIRQWRDNRAFDLIISNPPFFTEHLSNPNKQKAMARHNTGLPLSSLLQCIEHHLKEDGDAWLILPSSEVNELRLALTQSTLFIDKMTSVRSKPEKRPHRQFIRLKPNPMQSNPCTTNVVKDEICIHNGDGYDARFKALLQPYYLKL